MILESTLERWKGLSEMFTTKELLDLIEDPARLTEILKDTVRYKVVDVVKVVQDRSTPFLTEEEKDTLAKTSKRGGLGYISSPRIDIIDIIKNIRERHGCDLVDAADLVDAYLKMVWYTRDQEELAKREPVQAHLKEVLSGKKK